MLQRFSPLLIAILALTAVFGSPIRPAMAQGDDENRWNDAPLLVNPALGNPLEQDFRNPDTLKKTGKPSAAQGRFSDGSLPPNRDTANSKTASTTGRQPIVQTSAAEQPTASSAATPGSIWNAPSADADQGASWPFAATQVTPSSAMVEQQTAAHSNTPAVSHASPQAALSGNYAPGGMMNADPSQAAYALAMQQQMLAAGGIAPYPLPAGPTLDPGAAYAQAPYPGAYGMPFAAGYAPPYAAPYGYDPYGAASPYAYHPSMNMADPYLMARQQQMGGMPPRGGNGMGDEAAARRSPVPTSDEENVEDEDKVWSMDDLMPLKVSSPLAKTLWTGAGYLSPFTGADGPDKGVGMPLKMRSWTDRPYYFGGFFGYLSGSDLMNGSVILNNGEEVISRNVRIRQEDGGYGGLILGWNFHNYWGLEGRLHFTSLNLKYDYDDPELLIDRPAGSNQMTTCDVSVHYYPLGNSRWRPFFKYGLGLTSMSFTHYDGTDKTATTMAMPIGFGLKYWWNERMTIHAEVIDNIIFGVDGTKTQDNWGLSFGMTWSFGRNKSHRPTAYWPYTPSGCR